MDNISKLGMYLSIVIFLHMGFAMALQLSHSFTKSVVSSIKKFGKKQAISLSKKTAWFGAGAAVGGVTGGIEGAKTARQEGTSVTGGILGGIGKGVGTREGITMGQYKIRRLKDKIPIIGRPGEAEEKRDKALGVADTRKRAKKLSTPELTSLLSNNITNPVGNTGNNIAWIEELQDRGDLGDMPQSAMPSVIAFGNRWGVNFTKFNKENIDYVPLTKQKEMEKEMEKIAVVESINLRTIQQNIEARTSPTGKNFSELKQEYTNAYLTKKKQTLKELSSTDATDLETKSQKFAQTESERMATPDRDKLAKGIQEYIKNNRDTLKKQAGTNLINSQIKGLKGFEGREIETHSLENLDVAKAIAATPVVLDDIWTQSKTKNKETLSQTLNTYLDEPKMQAQQEKRDEDGKVVKKASDHYKLITDALDKLASDPNATAAGRTKKAKTDTDTLQRNKKAYARKTKDDAETEETETAEKTEKSTKP